MKFSSNYLVLVVLALSIGSTQAMHLGRAAGILRAAKLAKTQARPVGLAKRNFASSSENKADKNQQRFETAYSINTLCLYICAAATGYIFGRTVLKTPSKEKTMSDAERRACVKKVRDRNDGLESDFARSLYPEDL